MFSRIADVINDYMGWMADWLVDNWIIAALIGFLVLMYVAGPLRILLAWFGV